ncbi:hypothetical protein DL95DRAFT_450347 [Leptodontidium sp. 2 PMI_412]|nr:hypothetical protein DL95DRAFT_450347 [Leptodontidium sp. 2 PMI_412]
MSHTSSTSTASMEGPSESVPDEANNVYKVIKKLRGGMQVAIIAIVRPEALEFLEKRCQLPWWKRPWRVNSTILVTTDDGLRGTIRRLRKYPQYAQYNKLVILASHQIEFISYKVSGRFHTLVIHRCESHQQAGLSSGVLFIDGASTFNRVRMDRWGDVPPTRELKLEGRIAFRVDANWSNSGAGFRSNYPLSSSGQRQVATHLSDMEMAYKRGEWWQDWKGAIAGILGLVTAGSKFAMGLDATAKGMFVQFQWGGMSLKAASASSKLATMATGAGPAVVLGVGVAAAVYFIPWVDMFNWLEENVFSRFRSWFAALWEHFRSWLNSQPDFLEKPFRGF